jgi:hypothetical protein
MVSLCTINASVRSGGPYRTEVLNGREYWVVPFVSLVEGVLNGSKGPLFYPGEEISRNPGIWNGTLLTNGHPTRRDGTPMSGRTPEVLESHGLGYVFNDWAEDKRRGGDAYFDKEWTRKKAPAIANALEKGELIELSTGVGTTDHPIANTQVDRRGRAYNRIARDYLPDHLAVLSSQRGACSIVDGCGIGRNAEGGGKVCPECGADMTAKGACSECGYTANSTGVTVPPNELDVELVEQADKVVGNRSMLQAVLMRAINALWPGQVRSDVTGRIKPVGAGHGDPRVRVPAQAGFHAVVPGQDDIDLGEHPHWAADQVLWEKASGIAKEQGKPEDSAYIAAVYRQMGGTRNAWAPYNNQPVTGADMAATRAENVAHLVANCDCWKNKAGVLNDANIFSDQQIADLVAQNQTISVLRKHPKFANISLNAFPAAAEELPAEEEEEEEEEVMNKGKKVAKNGSNGGTTGDPKNPEDPEKLAADVAANMAKNPAILNAFCQAAFGRDVEAVKAGLDFGTRNADARKNQIIDQLVSALPEGLRVARRQHYSKLSLNELNDRLQDMVAAGTLAPANNNDAPRTVYGGHLDVTDNNDNSQVDNAGADETFDIVAMNWDAK